MRKGLRITRRGHRLPGSAQTGHCDLGKSSNRVSQKRKWIRSDYLYRLSNTGIQKGQREREHCRRKRPGERGSVGRPFTFLLQNATYKGWGGRAKVYRERVLLPPEAKTNGTTMDSREPQKAEIFYKGRFEESLRLFFPTC